MQFSEKEKRILIILSFCLIPVLYLYLYYLPQSKGIKELEGKLEKFGDTYEMNVSYAKKVEGLEKDLKILYQKQRDLWAVFPPQTNVEEIIIFIKKLGQDTKVDIKNVTFEKLELVDQTKAKTAPKATDKGSALSPELTPQPDSEEAKNDVAQDKNLTDAFNFFGVTEKDDGAIGESISENEIPNGKSYVLSIGIDAQCTYTDLKTLVSTLKSKRNKIEIRKTQIDSNPDGMLNVKLSIGFYGIRDTADESTQDSYSILADIPWSPLSPSNKVDIFKPYGDMAATLAELKKNSATEQEKNQAMTLDELSKYDFTMRVLPYGNNMAPPTISLVAKNIVPVKGENAIPIVYGDGNKEEKVDITVEEKNKVFYCKFKTDEDGFPDETYSKTVEFMPVGDQIQLFVDATPRKFTNDTASVIINVVNKTKKKFIIRVSNDDTNSPRVKVNTKATNVAVVND